MTSANNNFANDFGAYQKTNSQVWDQTQPGDEKGYNYQANNPYGLSMIAGANQGGQYMQQAGQQAIGNAGNLSGASNQLYQQAFDPQSALYNQQQQQLSNQTNAYNSANGIASSPYGASVAANAQGNFQNQWQNQQLGREAQGVQAMSGAATSANSLGQSGANAYAQGAAMPYGAEQTYGQGLLNAGQGYFNAASPYMTGLGNEQNQDLTYMGYGSAAQNSTFNQNMQNSIYGNQMGQQIGQSGVGQAIGNAWNNWGASPSSSGTTANTGYSGTTSNTSLNSVDVQGLYGDAGYGIGI
jgi:hypothetical protein